jgi:hypothetical protein
VWASDVSSRDGSSISRGIALNLRNQEAAALQQSRNYQQGQIL